MILITLISLMFSSTNYPIVDGYANGEKTLFQADVLPIKDLYGHDIYLEYNAAQALKDMIEAAAKDGIEIRVTFGYRTQKTQKRIKKRNPYLAAKPGYSPHQSGLAVDIAGCKTYKKSLTYKWLKANASKFGYSQTMKHEYWHWEYSNSR